MDVKRQLRSGRVAMITLIQMLAVAEQLSFRHTVNMLSVAQSAVDNRIKLVEEELGICIFKRSTRGVRLTQAGRRFVERVANDINRLDHAVKTVGAFARAAMRAACALVSKISHPAASLALQGRRGFWPVAVTGDFGARKMGGGLAARDCARVCHGKPRKRGCGAGYPERCAADYHIVRIATEPSWSLEFVNVRGASIVWSDVFASDREADAAFPETLAEEDAQAFLDKKYDRDLRAA